MEEYDVIVLGGGSGGYAAAKKASGLGLKVAVVDGAEELGGLCILRGCMPTKALLETSSRMRAIRPRHGNSDGTRDRTATCALPRAPPR